MSPQQLDQALLALRAKGASEGSLWLGLLESMRIDEAALAQALRDGHGVEVISDERWVGVTRLPDAAAAASAAQTGAATNISLFLDGQNLLLCEDPWSEQANLAMSRSDLPDARLALTRPGQMALALRMPAGPKAPTQTPSQTPAQAPRQSPATQTLQTGADAAEHDSPVVRFVNEAIARAYTEGASDIHFETNRAGIKVKYRLDGVMLAGERLDDPQRAEEVVSRIKVMAQLDITERRRPQDGRIHWNQAGLGSIDLRVSIMPSIFGEDAVLRLLDKAQMRQAQQNITLDALGFDAATAAAIRALATRPHGMLLVTGPTGSGKTTTVYAALTEVNDGLEKIVTIEDPVEYELPGVLQIPVNEQKGLTFATGLRSILRHDPDKILVGEIRDAETAEIAVQSSLTGHLVFTTVHANSLFDVLGRFQHFAIEPFALSSALNGIVVQRLLRRLCRHCATQREPTPAERSKLAALDLPCPDKLPKAQGCDHCRHTGYKGRFVVAEVHDLDETARDMIARKTASGELRSALRLDPSKRLLAQAMAQVQQGATSIEEVARVVGLA